MHYAQVVQSDVINLGQSLRLCVAWLSSPDNVTVQSQRVSGEASENNNLEVV